MTMLNIVPECYVDTTVVRILGNGIRKLNHQHGSGDVANQLQKSLLNHVALAIIDEDPKKGIKSKYFSEFITLQQTRSLLLKKHQSRHHYLIIIRPEMEKWLLQEAQSVDVNLEDYQLTIKLADLKQKSKFQSIDKDQMFAKFIKELVARKAPGISTLQEWLKLFIANEFDKLSIGS